MYHQTFSPQTTRYHGETPTESLQWS